MSPDTQQQTKEALVSMGGVEQDNEDPTIAGPMVAARVQLITSSRLVHDNGRGTTVNGPDNVNLAPGDVVSVDSGAGANVVIDTGDGATIDIYPGSTVTMEPMGTAGDFDILLQAGGHGIYNRASGTAAATPRAKMLRAPGISVGAIGSVYDWQFSAGFSSVVKYLSGTSLTLSAMAPNPNWTVQLGPGEQTSFVQGQTATPIISDIM